MGQEFIGKCIVKNDMNIISEGNYGLKNGEVQKNQIHNIKYFKNGDYITCVLVNKYGKKGIGVVKHNPKDEIIFSTYASEFKARENFYKNIGDNFIENYLTK